ncbi:expressed unknown protein [Ectocarpus siliculosus]|uniref:Uncharacterized protein n=1 Tax=Ectocarpus siliculosus TaxID=2880 RepID=D7FTW3_ECTSI|nr:expressed unknown protein [Ectocarpus siliculosus]|eukprot:CBJ31490.1 expressed unknown protein [Ectocarpus siliculosus]
MLDSTKRQTSHYITTEFSLHDDRIVTRT